MTLYKSTYLLTYLRTYLLYCTLVVNYSTSEHRRRRAQDGGSNGEPHDVPIVPSFRNTSSVDHLVQGQRSSVRHRLSEREAAGWRTAAGGAPCTG